MTSSRTPFTVVTGIALILLPFLGLVFKFLSMGWMALVVIAVAPALLLGYGLQIVIAAQGFLSSRALFSPSSADTQASRRGTIAAWVTSAGVLTLGLFLTDLDDVSYGSTVQRWLGSYGPNREAVHAATDTINDAIALVAAIAWLLGFVWLVTEWIIALVKRKKARVKR